jgi:hypothetical protein
MENILRILVDMEINRIPKEIAYLGNKIAPPSMLNDIVTTGLYPTDSQNTHFIQYVKLNPIAPVSALLLDAMIITLEYSMLEYFVEKADISICTDFLQEYNYLFTEKYIKKLHKCKFLNDELDSDQLIRKMILAMLFKKRPNWLYDKDKKKLKFTKTEIFKNMVKFLNQEELPPVKLYQVFLLPEEQFSDTSKIIQLIGHPVFKKAGMMRKLIPIIRLSGAIGITVKYERNDDSESASILSADNKNFIQKTLSSLSRNTMKTFINIAWEGVKMLPGSKFEYLSADNPEEGIEKSVKKITKWVEKSR